MMIGYVCRRCFFVRSRSLGGSDCAALVLGTTPDAQMAAYGSKGNDAFRVEAVETPVVDLGSSFPCEYHGHKMKKKKWKKGYLLRWGVDSTGTRVCLFHYKKKGKVLKQVLYFAANDLWECSEAPCPDSPKMTRLTLSLIANPDSAPVEPIEFRFKNAAMAVEILSGLAAISTASENAMDSLCHSVASTATRVWIARNGTPDEVDAYAAGTAGKLLKTPGLAEMYALGPPPPGSPYGAPDASLVNRSGTLGRASLQEGEDGVLPDPLPSHFQYAYDAFEARAQQEWAFSHLAVISNLQTTYSISDVIGGTYVYSLAVDACGKKSSAIKAAIAPYL